MKLIFLDIDGVLNSSGGRGPYISDMEIEKLELLRTLIEDTKASGIVITSDRRYSEVDMKNKLMAFNKHKINVVGQLRNPNDYDYDDNRGKQIVDYLSASKDDIDKIVILDDMDDEISTYFDEEFILVNRIYGLNIEIYKKAKEILEG